MLPLPADETTHVIRPFISRIAESNLANSTIPGLSYAVGTSDRVLFADAFGMRDVNSRSAMQIDTQLHAASQTKMLTAMAVWQLQEACKLDLYEPVAKYLPWFAKHVPEAIRNLDIHGIMVHKSRLPRDFADEETQLDLPAALTAACTRAGLGQSPAYSNIAYSVLAEVISTVADQPYDEYISAEVIKRVGMDHSGWKSEVSHLRSKQYGVPVRGECQEVADTSATRRREFPGAVGLWSTPSDLCRLAGAFMSNRSELLSVASRRTATAVQWGPAAGGRSFGLGLEVRWMAGVRWFGHTGGAPGFVSATYFCPEEQHCFSVAFNRLDVTALEQFTELLATTLVLFGEQPAMGEGDRRVFGKFVGEYRSDIAFTEIVLTPRACYAVDPNYWNPFSQARPLEVCDTETLRVVGDDFDYANTLVTSVNGTDLRVGVHQFSRWSGSL